MPTPLLPDGPIGTVDQILADLQAQIAALKKLPSTPAITARIAALQAVAATLQ